MTPRIDEHMFSTTSLPPLECLSMNDEIIIQGDTNEGNEHSVAIVSIATNDEINQPISTVLSSRLMVQCNSNYKIRSNALFLLRNNNEQTIVDRRHNAANDEMDSDNDDHFWNNKPASRSNTTSNPYIVPVGKILAYLFPLTLALFLFALRLKYNMMKEEEEKYFQRRVMSVSHCGAL